MRRKQEERNCPFGGLIPRTGLVASNFGRDAKSSRSAIPLRQEDVQNHPGITVQNHRSALDKEAP